MERTNKINLTVYAYLLTSERRKTKTDKIMKPIAILLCLLLFVMGGITLTLTFINLI